VVGAGLPRRGSGLARGRSMRLLVGGVVPPAGGGACLPTRKRRRFLRPPVRGIV
jgi:hypothetical protein